MSTEKSSKNNDKMIIKLFKILHKMGRPLGLSCFTLPAEDEKPLIKITAIDLVLFIFIFSLNVYLTYYNYQFWETVSKLHKRDTLFNTGIKLMTTGSLLFSLIGAIIVFVMREHIWNIVVTLQDIVEKAEKYDMKIENGRNYRYFGYYLFSLVLIIYSIIVAYSVYVSVYLADFDFVYLLSHVKSNVTFAYVCWKFQFLIFAIGTRFHLLNLMFEKKIDAALIANNSGVDFDAQLIGDLIFIVGDFHDTLNSLATKLNSYFAMVILPIYGGNFVITVFSFHNLYKTFMSNDSTFYYLAVFLLVMAIYFNIMVANITLGSERAKKLANHLGVLIHKTINKTQNKFILQRLHILSQQVLHITPTFSCGLFTVDWPMQFTFVSALASYLIILMQFQNYINNE